MRSFVSFHGNLFFSISYLNTLMQKYELINSLLQKMLNIDMIIVYNDRKTRCRRVLQCDKTVSYRVRASIQIIS